MTWILASASPRRKELLRLIHPDFTVVPSDAEEILPDDISPERAPEYLASLKARAVAQKYPDDLVIGADTAVILGRRIYGKPADAEDARQMLSQLSGREHKVITGCCLCCRGRERVFSQKTLVRFFPLTAEEIDRYVATGEPMDKAGAYGIQEQGALLVDTVLGDYFNVVGLPVARLNREITDFLSQV